MQVGNPSTNAEAAQNNPNNVVAAGIEEQQPAVPGNMVVQYEEQRVPVVNVLRIMRRALPRHAKISDDAKVAAQTCVTEFISFITGEANERCQLEHRKIVSAEDVLWAMERLGFDDYVGPLALYLQRYRDNDAEPLLRRVVGNVPVWQDVASLGMPPVPPPALQTQPPPLGSYGSDNFPVMPFAHKDDGSSASGSGNDRR